MTKNRRSKISQLINKGVKIFCPESVEISQDVDVEKISHEGVVVYPGCKIFGNSTLILKGAKIGYEGPVTLENCQVGAEVDLKGGFFKESVFLNNAKAGLGSHVREATILEEQASIAHTVGLKHTILFPFVTLGSLINFCDCLMAGGTSRKNHSEVGSSYIHFNFTPHQDKATASLLGDVPKGVMLNQKPIFLGGQGGLIGPCRLTFGTTVAAGTIVRQDELKPGRLLFGGAERSGNIQYTSDRYLEKRVVINNIVYIANLIALNQWYNQVRALFVSNDFPEPLLDGLKANLNLAITERIQRLGSLCDTFRDYVEQNGNNKATESSRALKSRAELCENWPQVSETLIHQRHYQGETNLRDTFLEKIQRAISETGKNYIAVIRGLKESNTDMGTRWLQGIVDDVTHNALNFMPSYKRKYPQ